MSDALTVEHGREPWLPVAHATPGEVLDLYDVPRAGLLHVRGVTYFFDCLFGDGAPKGVWAYAHVHDDQIKALLSAYGPDEFESVAAEILSSGWVTVALATNYKIIESTVLDAHGDHALRLVERFLEHLEDVIQARDDVRSLVASSPA